MIRVPKQQTPEQRETIQLALSYKERLGCKTDREFCDKFLGPISESRWGRLRDNKYGGNLESSFMELRKCMHRIELILNEDSSYEAVKAGLSEDYFHLDVFKTIENALQQAMSEKGQNRLVFVVLPTGGGKTATCEYFRAKYGAHIVHALPNYRKTSLPFLVDLLKAIKVLPPGRKILAQEVLLEEYNKRGQEILCIDEGNTFGPESFDVLKLLLNKTKWTVVFCCTPEHYHRMMLNYWDHTNQILRRNVVTITIDEIQDVDVRPFLEPLVVKDDLRKACTLVAEAANLFGAFDFCQRVRKKLKPESDLASVQKAVTTCKQFLRVDDMARARTKKQKEWV